GGGGAGGGGGGGGGGDRAGSGPPRWLVVLVLAGLGALLFYPIHVPYQNPDEDVPPFMALVELVRGGWRPINFIYPPALTNLLHLGYVATLAAARVAGRTVEPLDLLEAWYRAPWLFRLPPRLLAMGGGVGSLGAAGGRRGRWRRSPGTRGRDWWRRCCSARRSCSCASTITACGMRRWRPASPWRYGRAALTLPARGGRPWSRPASALGSRALSSTTARR